MKGATGSRENVIIDHQFSIGVGKPSCTLFKLFNISFVNITALTLRCPNMYLDKSLITVKTSNLYGYPGINESLSIINITGTGTQAVLDNCTFKENCFIMSFIGGRIVVSNSIFQSYRHQSFSIIFADSSVVTLAGNINFTDSITGIPSSMIAFGTAVFLQRNSSLNITTGATVYFVNLTSSRGGGAVYGFIANMHIGDKARVVFMHNTGYFDGGAVKLWDGMITIGVESCVMFMYNCAVLEGGGALVLFSGTLIVEHAANLTFNHNSANAAQGGALELVNSTAHLYTDIGFFDNKASSGGAMYFVYATMIININISVKLIMNAAHVYGGAICIRTGLRPSIIVGNYSKLLFFNNSAFQGGALYSIMPSLIMTTVGYHSSIQFIDNTALDVGGAVYSQSSPPCIFMIMDYSTKISFTGNYAQRGVGHHMYGASV